MLIFYMRSYIFISFGKNLFKILIPYGKQFILESKALLVDNLINLISKKNNKEKINPYTKINIFLEKEY